MKLPERNGFYKYYEGFTKTKTIVKFSNGKIYMFHDDQSYNPDLEDEDGSYFLEPVEPIKFD